MENNKLIVKNLDGKELTIEVIDIIEDSETGKQFICYTTDELDDVFVSSLEETDDTFTLGEVTEEERNIIEVLMNQNIEGE